MKKYDLKLPKSRTITTDASILKRIAAFLTDLLILDLIIAFPFQKLLEKMIPSASASEIYRQISTNPALANQVYFIITLVGLMFIAYFAILEYKLGQTVGKMIFNIHVVSTKEKEDLKFWQCLFSNLIFIPLFPFIILWAVDPIYLFITKQTFSNSLTKTKVVEVHEI